MYKAVQMMLEKNGVEWILVAWDGVLVNMVKFQKGIKYVDNFSIFQVPERDFGGC